MEQFNKEFKPYINNSKDRNGNLLIEKDQILERWKEYFQEVFTMSGEIEEAMIDEINNDLDAQLRSPHMKK
jgi:hypothetical protein